MTKVKIEFDIPQALEDMGGIEMFAAHYGWTPTVNKLGEDGLSIMDEEGNIETEENPVSALEHGKRSLIKHIRNVVVETAKRKAMIDAAEAAARQMEALMPEV